MSGKVIIRSIMGLVVGSMGGCVGGCLPAVILEASTPKTNAFMHHDFPVILIYGGILTGAIIGFYNPIRKEAKEKDEAREKQQRWDAEWKAQKEAEELKNRENEKTQLKKMREELSSLSSTSHETFLRIPKLVHTANHHLNRAEEEFSEGAFAPFWDEVEIATKKLAEYKNQIELINYYAKKHREVYDCYVEKYRCVSDNVDELVPQFNLPIAELIDARPSAARLAAIVRKAQKNFEFSTIYEQRKTNKLLVSGFSTLASAIYSIGDAITSSLNDLSKNLEFHFDELLEASNDQKELLEAHSRQQEGISNLVRSATDEYKKRTIRDAASRKQFEKDLIDRADEHADQLKKQNEILVKIQKREKE